MGKTEKLQGRAVQRAPLLLQIPASTERIIMLARKTPDTLAVELTIKGQGETQVVPVVFYNRTHSQIAAKTDELNEDERKSDQTWLNAELFKFVVKEFNGVIPTSEGIAELEDNWPGSVIGIYYAYHDARRVEVTKNSKPQ